MVSSSSLAINNASINGTYAFTSIGRGGDAPCAAIGIINFDGNGHVSGSSTTNLPGSTFQERLLVKASIQGTYTIDADNSGFGSCRFKSLVANGSIQETGYRLMLNQVGAVNGSKVATLVTLIQDKLDPVTGSLNTATATRLADEGVFSLASIKGTYSGIGFAWSGRAAISGTGFITYDGKGNTHAANTQSFPGATFGERVFYTYDTPAGTYTVNEDGTGTIVSAQEYQIGAVADLVITKAKIVDGINVAQEYFFILRDLLPTGGLATSIIYKREPD
jgi:hypothetical protein